VANNEINVERVKKSWTQEEIMRLAHAEARLTVSGVGKVHLNRHLYPLFPHRTSESVKGRRRDAGYKLRVLDFIRKLNEAPLAPPASFTTEGEEPTDFVREAASDEGGSKSDPQEGSSVEVNAKPTLSEATDPPVGPMAAGSHQSIVGQKADGVSSLQSQGGGDNTRIHTDAGKGGIEAEGSVLTPPGVVARIRDFLLSLPKSDLQRQIIDETVKDLRDGDPEVFRDQLEVMIDKIFPPKIAKAPSAHLPAAAAPPLSRRKARRAEYARCQGLFRKNPTRCIHEVLADGECKGPAPPETEEILAFWHRLMTLRPTGQPGRVSSAIMPRCTEISYEDLWQPINMQELNDGLPPGSSSPGPDGTKSSDLRQIPRQDLLKIMNLILAAKQLPPRLLVARTVLIPKVVGPTTPSDYRPITITSVITRAFHKIIGARLVSTLRFDPRQTAFQPFDGMMDNLVVLDHVIQAAHKRLAPTYIASIDVSKAFDSVDHRSIAAAMQAHGLPGEFITYINECYNRSTTALTSDGQTSRRFKPSRGVLQGDPMSPMIFNLCIDVVLAQLPEHIGVRCLDGAVNAAAYADDILLFASTEDGLQELINVVVAGLKTFGLDVNTKKTFTLSLKPSGKDKKMKVTAPRFYAGKVVLPSVGPTDTFKYLGVEFCPTGRCFHNPVNLLKDKLMRIQRAPLKPQQRLYALSVFVIPGLHHVLSLSRTHIGVLKKCDLQIREKLRRWFRLPPDTPKAYFHAAVADGGLGVPELRWTIPLLRLNRLRRLAERWGPGAGGCETVSSGIERSTKRLSKISPRSLNSGGLKEAHADSLYDSIDGAALKHSSKTPGQHMWVNRPTRLLSGRDYVGLIRARINALPTRSRTSRGREAKDRHCRAGCNAIETGNHVMQLCFRTHAVRVKRHDAVVNFLARTFRNKGYVVLIEPKYRTPSGLKKPDLVVTRDDATQVIDVGVCGDSIDLDHAHRGKVRKYSSPELVDCIKQSIATQKVQFTAAIINWRGVWAPTSSSSLRGLGVSKEHLMLISTQVLIGSLAIFGRYNCMTSREPGPMSRVALCD
jgi:hypothetical protein